MLRGVKASVTMDTSSEPCSPVLPIIGHGLGPSIQLDTAEARAWAKDRRIAVEPTPSRPARY
ncbi:hypothetical protein PABY_03110 [Pyrodictium abyssi]|uniref:Uncharacterized protein n=1 Tax=Pyrodictium abyssi TaxID=54256 RepID=A0ABM8IT61_9CREN|nr:hypothetical protein PABY_03110 [Pyrodictium abyssi]